MIEANDIVRRLGQEETLPALQVEWEKSQEAMPSGGIDFLQPEQVRANLLACGFGPETFEPVLSAAARFQADPLLAALVWHYAWRIYESNDDHWFVGWPKLEKSLGPDGGLMTLLAGIAMAPRVHAHHRRMGIEAEVTRETCLQPYTFSLNYAETFDGWLGVLQGQLIWLRHYTREKYFRLGRYEFWLRRLDWDTPVYRSRRGVQALALAADDTRFDASGYCPGDQEPEQPGEWRSRLKQENGCVYGNPIDPGGFALRETVALNLDEWQLALTKGDWVLDMHIPAGGGMPPEAVRASFRRAVEFFPRHFPETMPKALVCWSWIYNPNLGEILPPESNLVRNLNDAYLLPAGSDPHDGLNFMFYQDEFDPATAPRKTSLQRAILDYLARGGRWRCGAMFYLLEDIDRLGTAVYRSQWGRLSG